MTAVDSQFHTWEIYWQSAWAWWPMREKSRRCVCQLHRSPGWCDITDILQLRFYQGTLWQGIQFISSFIEIMLNFPFSFLSWITIASGCLSHLHIQIFVRLQAWQNRCVLLEFFSIDFNETGILVPKAIGFRLKWVNLTVLLKANIIQGNIQMIKLNWIVFLL